MRSRPTPHRPPVRFACLGVLLAMAVGCAKAPEQTSASLDVHDDPAPREAGNPLVARPAAPAPPATPAPPRVSSMLPTAAATAGSETPAVPPTDDWSDDTVLRVYQDVVCARRLGSESSVRAVWEKHGVDAEGWTAAVQKAAEKAAADPQGFGERWSAIAASTCEQ